MSHTTTITLDDVDWEERYVKVKFEVDFEMSYTPAYTWGPPVYCTPAEGEVEINSITILEIDGKEVTGDHKELEKYIEETHEELLYEKCFAAGIDD